MTYFGHKFDGKDARSLLGRPSNPLYVYGTWKIAWEDTLFSLHFHWGNFAPKMKRSRKSRRFTQILELSHSFVQAAKDKQIRQKHLQCPSLKTNHVAIIKWCFIPDYFGTHKSCRTKVDAFKSDLHTCWAQIEITRTKRRLICRGAQVAHFYCQVSEEWRKWMELINNHATRLYLQVSQWSQTPNGSDGPGRGYNAVASAYRILSILKARSAHEGNPPNNPPAIFQFLCGNDLFICTEQIPIIISTLMQIFNPQLYILI